MALTTLDTFHTYRHFRRSSQIDMVAPTLCSLRVNPVTSGMPRIKTQAVSRHALASAIFNRRRLGCAVSVGSVASRRGAFEASVMLSNAVPFSRRSNSKASTRMCGIIGVFKHDGNANVEIYEGLLMLQHRGQDSAGMVTTDGAWLSALPQGHPPTHSLTHSRACLLRCALTLSRLQIPRTQGERSGEGRV